MFAVPELTIENSVSSTDQTALKPLQAAGRKAGSQSEVSQASELPEAPEAPEAPRAQREQSEFQVLLTHALKALARREHSTVELRRKLGSFSIGTGRIATGRKTITETVDDSSDYSLDSSREFSGDSSGDSSRDSYIERAGTSRATSTDDHINQVIEALILDGSLSDERFATEFVRGRVRKGYGPIRIRMDLLERGVPDRLAEEQLTRPSEFWQQRAAEVCMRKFGDPDAEDSRVASSGDLDDASPEQIREALKERKKASQRRWNRCARFLSQRGFPADLIYRTLDGRLLD